MNQFLIGTPIKNTRRGNQKMIYETPCRLLVFTNSENVSLWVFLWYQFYLIDLVNTNFKGRLFKRSLT